MKRLIIVFTSVMLVLILVACGGTETEGEEAATESTGVSTGDTFSTQMVSLSEDYENALTTDGQLALGSLKLEDDLAIDEEQAGQLLPLWQGYQSLTNSDKAAEAEVAALLKQIQGAMNDEQVQAIAAMQLTAEEVNAWVQENGGFGRGFMRPADTEGDADALPRGGFPGGIPGGGPGGGGGIPGTGPGGGFGQGAGDPDARATRMAEMGADEDMMGRFMNQAVFGMLIQDLQIKTGELDPAELEANRVRRNPWTVISEETGIEVETLQTGVSDGQSLAEVITENDGDVEAAESALREAFGDLPNLQEEGAMDEYINGFLYSTPDPADEGGE